MGKSYGEILHEKLTAKALKQWRKAAGVQRGEKIRLTITSKDLIRVSTEMGAQPVATNGSQVGGFTVGTVTTYEMERSTLEGLIA